MTRAFLVVMDSVGIGGAPDAGQFHNGRVPDTGANTVAHIAKACAAGRAEAGRRGPLELPNLDALGLGAAVTLASGEVAPGLGRNPRALWGAATEGSRGKDTPSGHWELAGLEVPWEWHVFPDTEPAFPSELTEAVCAAAGTDGILGNRRASGTAIIAELGTRHLRTGWPICYGSADSVFQVAAHEEAFGLDRLLDLCRSIAPRLHAMRVGRVIARPFTGSPASGFTRTSARRDFAMAPPGPTLLTRVQKAGGRVHAIGKIGDIFSMQGIDDLRTGADSDLMTHLSAAVEEAEDRSLTMANFVEFDSLYGHRRDVSGYAAALERFDAGLGAILPRLGDGDIMVISADHGNDPTWPGTDHTRERVPVLIAGDGRGSIGHLGFADVAARIALHLDLPRGWGGAQ